MDFLVFWALTVVLFGCVVGLVVASKLVLARHPASFGLAVPGENSSAITADNEVVVSINKKQSDQNKELISVLKRYHEMHSLPKGPEQQVAFVYCHKSLYELTDKAPGIFNSSS